MLWGAKMLAHCVQDATVVDVEKRRNPSKHYVSAARGGGRLHGAGVEEGWPETPPFTPGATPRGSPLSAQLRVCPEAVLSVLPPLPPLPRVLFWALQLASGGALVCYHR